LSSSPCRVLPGSNGDAKIDLFILPSDLQHNIATPFAHGLVFGGGDYLKPGKIGLRDADTDTSRAEMRAIAHRSGIVIHERSKLNSQRVSIRKRQKNENAVGHR